SPKNKEQVGKQSQDGHYTSPIVVINHEDHQNQKTNDQSDDTLLDVFLSKRRADQGFRNDSGLRGQFSHFQNRSQVVSILNGKITGNGTVAIRDGSIDAGSRYYFVIEDDGYFSVIILGCPGRHVGPDTRALIIHSQRNGYLVGDRIRGRCSFDHV